MLRFRMQVFLARLFVSELRGLCLVDLHSIGKLPSPYLLDILISSTSTPMSTSMAFQQILKTLKTFISLVNTYPKQKQTKNVAAFIWVSHHFYLGDLNFKWNKTITLSDLPSLDRLRTQSLPSKNEENRLPLVLAIKIIRSIRYLLDWFFCTGGIWGKRETL